MEYSKTIFKNGLNKAEADMLSSSATIGINMMLQAKNGFLMIGELLKENKLNDVKFLIEKNQKELDVYIEQAEELSIKAEENRE